MHILIIEPDIHLASAYARAMELAGHTVAHAHTAQEALIAADDQRPDVIALELQLPGANGVAFLQEFRSYGDWQPIPVILHTYVLPHGQGAMRKVLEEQYGVVAWLYKPQTSLTQLQTMLENHGNVPR